MSLSPPFENPRESARLGSGCSGTRIPLLLRLGELLEQRLGLRQREAGIGNALAVHHTLPGNVVLPPFYEMALEHRAENLTAARPQLVANRCGDLRLLGVIFQAVAVRAVNHHRFAQLLR